MVARFKDSIALKIELYEISYAGVKVLTISTATFERRSPYVSLLMKLTFASARASFRRRSKLL